MPVKSLKTDIIDKRANDKPQVNAKIRNVDGTIFATVTSDPIDSENLTPQHAAYYFNIATDASIDRSKFCQYVNDQSKDVFEDEFIDCGEAKSDLSLYNIYQPSPEDDDTGEIC